jgi:leader peptidase (prepilin peptidase) / N-methyltransferase
LTSLALRWSGMNPMWAGAGAIIGLLAGAVLRGTVFRLSVASGDPERTTCPHCTAPVRRWASVRCGCCRSSLGTPLVLELLLGRFGARLETLAFAFLGVLGVALAAIDITVQRLPDRLTLPAYPILIALLATAAIAGHDLTAMVRALLGGVTLAAGYLLLALLRPGQLGGGDIKLAGVAGLALGWLGWSTLIAGTVLGFVLSALVSLALLASRRITLRSQICFGPFLLGGALLAILISG